MQQRDTDIFYKKVILAGFFLLMLLHLMFVFCGFYGGDDINYARYAAGVVSHGINTTPAADQFQLRWVTVYSAAIFYKLFGMTAFTSSLSSYFSFVGCGIILFKILKKQALHVYLLSMVLFFFSHSIIFYSHRLLADPAVCFAALWMYYAYRNFYLKEEKPLRYAFYFAVALLVAIMAKETVIIFAPAFGVLFLKDFFQKKRMLFWKYAIALSALFVFLYLLYFKITTGDFLYRYHVLLSKSYFTECSYDQLPVAYTWRRIGYELWKAMLLSGDLLIYLPAAAAVIYRKKIGLRPTDAVIFFALLLCANFMTVSFTHYVPLCNDPRHFIFLIPFAAICGGRMLHAYFNEPNRFILLPLMLLLAAAAIFLLHGGNTKYLYLLFTLLLSAAYLQSISFKEKISAKAYTVIFILLFFANYLLDFIKPVYPFYGSQKKIVETYFSDKSQHATVYSADEVSGELNEFLLQFNTGNIIFKPLDSVKPNTSGSSLYLMVNPSLNPAVKAKADSLVNAYPENKIISGAGEKNIYLYKISDAFLNRLAQAP